MNQDEMCLELVQVLFIVVMAHNSYDSFDWKYMRLGVGKCSKGFCSQKKNPKSKKLDLICIPPVISNPSLQIG